MVPEKKDPLRNQSALTRDFSMAGYSNEFAGVS
jgi:hypothetical protein